MACVPPTPVPSGPAPCLQEGTTRRILEHCGLSWHPNMLRFYETKRFVYTASLLQVWPCGARGLMGGRGAAQATAEGFPQARGI